MASAEVASAEVALAAEADKAARREQNGHQILEEDDL